MNIHEYQAKTLLAEFGVAVPRGALAFDGASGDAFDESRAREAIAQLAGPVWVVKAQIHAGGRGKGGGVKVVDSAAAALDAVKQMAGMRLVTHQTGAAGKIVQRVYVEQGCAIARELYLAMLIDRASGRLCVIASTEGGMDIEQVAAESPDKILQVELDPLLGMKAFYARRIGAALQLTGKQIGAAAALLRALYRAFIECDAGLIEINPLVVDADGQLIALDAKMNFDSNALFRRANVESLRDKSEEDESEARAAEQGLNYIKLDGAIGCMVNGAGLAMATMDIIKRYGGAPANFLDVGGGASAARVTAAFKLLLSDADVKAVLVNIFGGIMRCDVIAEGIVAAAREVDIHAPLVVRLAGTNVEQGKAILADSGLPIVAADDLADAAEKAVAAAGG